MGTATTKLFFSNLLGIVVAVPIIIISIVILLFGWRAYKAYDAWLKDPNASAILLVGAAALIVIIGTIKIRQNLEMRR